MSRKYKCSCWHCLSSKEKKSLSRKKDKQYFRDRIQNYLENGGLVNPELMEHKKVRDLLIEIRDAI